MKSNHYILYEQPANDLIRTCLRIEHLASKSKHFLAGEHHWDSTVCITTLLDLLNGLDRPELRSKFAHELNRQIGNLNRLKQTPQVDHSRLNAALEKLESASQILHSRNGKFGEVLRRNEFIKAVNQQYLASGDTADYASPALSSWLQQNPHDRIAVLKSWFSQFNDLFTITATMMQLIRSAQENTQLTAIQGFYQTTLDANSVCQLIRVYVPFDANVYPKISLGHRGVSVRFIKLDLEGRDQSPTEDIHFEMCCCTF